jgi:hypothetical protein
MVRLYTGLYCPATTPNFVDFVAGFRFVPFVAVCGVCGDGHKIRHKSTFGEFRPQNPPHLASLAIVILKMTILCPE